MADTLSRATQRMLESLTPHERDVLEKRMPNMRASIQARFIANTRKASALGCDHGWNRVGHPDMINHMRERYTTHERQAYGFGILFGWFLRTFHHCG